MSARGTPPTPTAAEEANGQVDPLAGDWSEGLPGPARAHGVPAPKRISLNGHAQPPEQQLPTQVHDAHELLNTLSESPPAEEPAPASEPSPASAEPAAPPEEPSFDADRTQPSATPAFVDEAPAAPPAESAADDLPAPAAEPEPPPAAPEPVQDPAPTPWSEPVPSAEAGNGIAWEGSPSAPDPDLTPPEAWAPPDATADAEPASPAAPASEEATAEPAGDTLVEVPPEEVPPEEAPSEQPPAPDEAWSNQAAQPVEEWQAESAPADFEEVRAPAEEAAPAAAAAADWSSLNSGPDWSAPAAAPEAPAEEWAAPPPAQAAAEWSPAAPAAEPEWSPSQAAAPAAAEPAWSAMEAPAAPATEWSAPPEAPPKASPAWNQPAVGASALEQLDSEPPEPEPGAAKELFGSVPSGGMLAAENDEESLYGPPEELASPEEVLRPVPEEGDSDLLVPIDEPAADGPPPQPLGSFRPAGAGALEVHGEHRVAIQTRGGRTLRGTVRNIDLSKSQFPLAPQGGKGAEAIYHTDVKVIFFMLAPGEKAIDGDGGKVRVTFADGRVIEGIREGADAKHGFFLVPSDAARTNTRRIYVAREATSEIEDA